MENNRPLIIAIIPARGGSKGVPRKNILDLGGKPLIAYTVEVALQTKAIDHVVVSTEDEQIAELAEYFGAEIPFLRPPELATDDASLNAVIHHMHYGLREIWDFPEIYILITMLPTSPFKTVPLLNFLVDKALDGFNPITVKRIMHHELSIFARDDNHILQPLLPRGNNPPLSPRVFFRNYGLFLGCIWGYATARPDYIHVIDDPISLIDIDTWSDFYLAEAIIKQNLFDFGLT